MKPEPFARPEWTPVPRPGCRGVEVRVIQHEPEVLLAQLRFAADATIDEHAAEWDIDVACLEGRGFVSVAGEAYPLEAGQRIVWPAGVPHRLWTEGEPMTTLMLEYLPPGV